MKKRLLSRCPFGALMFNAAYGTANCAMGLLSRSWWLITVGAYHTVLSVTRFCVVQIGRRSVEAECNDRFARKVAGMLMVVLSLCLAGMNLLSALKDRHTAFHEIVMIAIAAYTFVKIALAIRGVIKTRKLPSSIDRTLRNIGFADAVVSVCTLQRSMLASFPGMGPHEVRLFNILTGTAGWMILLLLGIEMIGGKYVLMAKKKIVKTSENIANAVTGGYKKIENGVVNCYRKVEDRFIEAYLIKDGETIEQARARLKKETGKAERE